MRLRDLDMLSMVVLELLCNQQDEVQQAVAATALYDTEVPTQWESRFRRADAALDEMHDTVLSDILPENLLEGCLHDLCNPYDYTINVVLDGDIMVVDHILSTVVDGLIVREVIEAVRSGELSDQFRMSHGLAL